MAKQSKTLPLTPTFLPLINERLDESSRRVTDGTATIPVAGDMEMTISAQDLGHGRTLDYAHAQTWWISADMCTLVAASDSDESAREAVDELAVVSRMPETGIMYFERPVVFTDRTNPDGYQVAAIAWQILSDKPDDTDLQVFAPKGLPYSFDSGLDPSVPLGIMVPRYRQDIDMVKRLESGQMDPGIVMMELKASDLQLARFRAAAFRLAKIAFALMEQDHVADTRDDEPDPALLPSSVRKAAQRSRAKVRLAYVRNHTDEKPAGKRKNKPYEYRFIVSGHWRNQAYGREHRQRRRMWIAPFVKGPADKPLRTDKRPVVHIFDGK